MSGQYSNINHGLGTTAYLWPGYSRWTNSGPNVGVVKRSSMKDTCWKAGVQTKLLIITIIYNYICRETIIAVPVYDI